MLERMSQMSEELRTGIAYLEGVVDDAILEETKEALLAYVSHKVTLLKEYARCAREQFESSKERLSSSSVSHLGSHVDSLQQLASPTPAGVDEEDGKDEDREEFALAATFCDDIVDAWQKALDEGECCEPFVRDTLQRFVQAHQSVSEIFAVCSTHIGHLLMEDFIA